MWPTKCRRKNCRTRPVRVSLSQLDPPVLQDDLCRPHYLDDARAGGHLVRVKVLAANTTICGADRVDVSTGGEAVLDSRDTNVDMLVDADLVEVLGAVEPEATDDDAPAEGDTTTGG